MGDGGNGGGASDEEPGPGGGGAIDEEPGPGGGAASSIYLSPEQTSSGQIGCAIFIY